MKAIKLFVFFAIACDSDTTTKTFNDNPTIAIMSHADGFEALEGEVISFRAQVSDTNDNISDLQVAWYQGPELVCDWAVPFEEGDSYCDITIGSSDARIIAEVQDPSGAAGRAEIELLVTPNEAPTAQILSPVATDRFYSDQLISFHAFVADLEDNPEDLLLQWESSVDGELVVASVADSNGDATGAGYLTEGQHSLQLHVTDTMGKSVTESLLLQVGGPNSAPSCAITEPEDRSSATLGEYIIFTGTATDPDVPSESLVTQWSSDKDGPLGTGSINSAGELTLPYADLSADIHTITLEVSDEIGGLCTDTLVLTVGTAPTVTVTSPLSGDLYQVGESISFDAMVDDNDELPSQLAISWESDIDGVFSTQASDSNGSLSFNKSTLSAGSHSVSLTATDSSGLVTSQTIDFMVNTPPTAPTLTLTPASPDTGDTLLVTASGSTDADGHTISYSYAWYLNGALTNHATSAITSADTSKGEVWTVRVTANDGYHDGQLTEASVVIVNSDPVLSAVTVSPAAPSSSEQLTCSVSSSDADGETLTETITWSNLTSGATLGMGATLQLSSSIASNGDVIQCAVEVADSDTSVSGANTVTVVNTAPEFTSAAVIVPANGVTTSSILTCSGVAVDTDGSLPNLTYAWSNLTAGTSLGSSASLTLTASSVSPTDVVQCTITATDADGESVDSSDSVQVSNSAPVVNSVSILPASGVTTASSVGCSAGVSDPDAEQLSVTYAWSNGSTGASLGTGASLTLSPGVIQPGEILVCTASVTDGYGASTSDSTSVTVDNSAPVIVSVTITPANPYNDDSLNCAVSASDVDGQSLAASVSWINTSTGTGLGLGVNLTLSSATAMPGETIQCTVDVDDGMGGSASLSSSVILGNRAPDLPVLAISPNPATSLDTLECVLSSATDPDGDSVTPAYAWYVNSILDPAETASTYGGALSSGDTVACTVITSDGALSSPMGSATLTLSNTPPVIDSLVLSPDPVRTDDALTATVVASDAEGDAITLDYTWSVNGVAVQNGAMNSLASSNYVRGNIVSVTVTPSDANAIGPSAIDGLTVTNTAPTAASVVIAPTSPVEGVDDLVCSASGSSDADGDSISYSFAWTVDGVVFIGASTSGSTSTVTAVNTFGGEQWQCTVVPNDGYEDGALALASVSIGSAWAGALTFTTCGKTGRDGPSQSQCDSAYSGGPLAGQVTILNGGYQYWTVPSTGTYSIETIGSGENYAKGALISGEFSLTAGDVLKIVVGQQGELGGGGHGGTFVAFDDNTPIIVAGGGGGITSCTTMTSYSNGTTSINGNSGNVGAGGSNGNGGNATQTHTYGGGGGGGFYTDGTDNTNYSGKGNAFISSAYGGALKASANREGGFGGGGAGYTSNEPAGGGGYSGGGGGGAENHSNLTGSCRHGGGGGSYNSGANASGSAGYNDGQGQVIIDRP